MRSPDGTRRWTVFESLDEIVLELGGPLRSDADPTTACCELEGLLARGLDSSEVGLHGVLRDVHRELAGPRYSVWTREEKRAAVTRTLMSAAQSGRLVVRRQRMRLPDLGPVRDVWKSEEVLGPEERVIYKYPVTVIDDTGQPVARASIKFDFDGAPRMVTTDRDGDGTTDWEVDTAAKVRVLDLPGLRKRLRPSWKDAPASLDPASVRQRLDRDPIDFRASAYVRTTIVLARPGIVRTRLIGAFFDTSKSFLLPSAVAGVRGLKRQYDQHPRATALVVGHTDTSGSPDYNDTLSLERAKAVAAFLKNDVSAWEAWFASDKPDEKRWAVREVQLMLSELPERAQDTFWTGTASGRSDSRTRKAVSAFQQWSNDTRGTSLDVDGKAGPKTRHEIIAAYMALQDTTLPDGTEIVTHGCGESFPAEPTPEGTADAENRRVEIFLFDGPVDPPPAGDISKPGATDYPQWLVLLQQTIDFTGNPDDDLSSAVRLLSVASANRTFPKPSWIPVLADISARLVADPSLHVLVVGNCDETGDAGLNRSLSLARANAVRALLLQDADMFRAQFHGAEAGEPWDWQEIQWMLSAIQVDGAPCYAGFVDGQRGDTALAAIELFQIENDLVPTRAADDRTLNMLIERYMALLGEEAPEPEQVEVAAGGAGLVPRTFGPDSAQVDDPSYDDPDFEGFRRIEMFLSTKNFEPAPESLDNVSGPDHPTYATWCKSVARELPAQTTLPVWVQVVDRFGVAASGGDVMAVADDGSETPFGGLSPGARGIARLDAPVGTYAIRFGDDGLGQRVVGLHVRLDEVGGVVVRLMQGELDG